MQLDSHRRQLSDSRPVLLITTSATSDLPVYRQSAPPSTTVTMPCRFACRRPRLSFATPDPNAASPPVAALDAYRQNRRTWLFMLRRQTRVLMFLFATLEAIWRGPSDIVQGKNYNAEIDHGFVYSIGYFFSWVFGCVFTVIWASLFEVSRTLSHIHPLAKGSWPRCPPGICIQTLLH